MDMEKMMEATNKLVNVKPSKYVFCFCAVAWALNVFAGYTPSKHQLVGDGYVKLSKEAVQAFKSCFPKDQLPEIKIKA
jgi:hypothetical protein